MNRLSALSLAALAVAGLALTDAPVSRAARLPFHRLIPALGHGSKSEGRTRDTEQR